MKYALFMFLLAVSLSARSVAALDLDQAPVEIMEYQPDVVMVLRARMGYALDLELQDREQVVNIAAGNIALLNLGVEGNHVFIKPTRPGVATNLMILTDKRLYRFKYLVESEKSISDQQPVYSVVFRFQSPVIPVESPLSANPEPALNTNYWYCGSASLKPLETFDDGVRTYLRFPKDVELPVPYSVEEDGEERLVNMHVTGDWIVVHQTLQRMLLRRGAQRGCVQNRPGILSNNFKIARVSGDQP